MRNLGIILTVTIAFAVGAFFVAPRTAECVWCPTYTCWGSCGDGCACITPPGSGAGGGKCYGVQRGEELVDAGWSIVR